MYLFSTTSTVLKLIMCRVVYADSFQSDPSLVSGPSHTLAENEKVSERVSE